MDIKWAQYSSYSGPVIYGTEKIDVPITTNHVTRAWYLSTMVETGGKRGSINMYDGTAITAGASQYAGVLKDGAQGKLWDFLGYMTEWSVYLSDNFKQNLNALHKKLADNKLTLLSGKLLLDGIPAVGEALKDIFTPPFGVVPRSGKDWDTAASWAETFYKVFSDPDGFELQDRFDKIQLVNRCKNQFITLDGKKQSVNVCVYIDGMETSDIGQYSDGWTTDGANDLALCVYQSHAVNAPAIATRILQEVLQDTYLADEDFSYLLIKQLANSNYGQWNWKLKNGRYQRTRTHALKSGFWDKRLFEGDSAIMPESVDK